MGGGFAAGDRISPAARSFGIVTEAATPVGDYGLTKTPERLKWAKSGLIGALPTFGP